MRKTDKKIDNQLRLGLTAVCDYAMATYPGFVWITHLVNYGAFPSSLRIICVFDTDAQLRTFNQSGHKAGLLSVIKDTLAKEHIEDKKYRTTCKL
ncbi:Fis family transcriptional regulator [Shewanella sp. A14]